MGRKKAAKKPDPPSYIMPKRSLWKFALPVYVILFLILLDSILAPFLESRMISESYYFYSILRNFCHQLPSRCLWIFGSNMGLCSRCFGIFLGLFLIGVYYGIKGKIKIYWKISIIFVIPLLIDGITQIIGLRQSNNLLRLATGFLFGLGIGSIMYPLYFRLVIFIKKIIKKGGANRLVKNQAL
jgi:uncharacterized membrane protein